MRTENTATNTTLESITIRTYKGTKKQHYLSPTEELIFELICSLTVSVEDKIKLVGHYQSVLDFDLFNHFWDLALFVEQLKKKMRAQ